VQALVEFAGGRDPGPLALPSEVTEEEPEDRPEDPANREAPPPLPSGPWSDAKDPAAASQGASQGPWVNPAGPWGRP
jgi:heat shock protein HtpX